MAGYVDRSLIHNSALACFLLANFVKEYQALTANTRYPPFEKLLLVLPIVWHGPSRSSISGRIFSTPMHAVLNDEPRIAERLADRIAAHAAVSCQGLNIACETGLLIKRESARGEKVFAFGHSHWPRGSKPTTIPGEMLGTTVRLANWFKDMTGAELFALLGIH
ncbi:three component ABC system middle component [Paraburkholderia strydomiana]|uniref:three component ABC system middle component n=1 Tax=Paraburkholderia strydomiana TaxID=1245417 RepID=UPI0038B92CBE